MNWLRGLLRPGKARRSEPQIRKIGKAWKATNQLEPLADDAKVVFTIPLIGKARAEDWDRVEQNLAATVRSLRAQRSGEWIALICGQDKPLSLELDDQVRFLEYPKPADPALMSDKGSKIRFMLKHLVESWRKDGYFFMLDADDLLHPDLVGHFIECGDRDGYILAEGYMLDASSGRLAYLGENRIMYPHSSRFYSHCGSCAAIRMDLRNGRSFADMVLKRGKHRLQVHNLATFGVYLKKVPFAAGIYVINHGENLRKRRGKLDTKLRYIARNRNLLSPKKTAQVRNAFDLDRILDRE